MELHHQAYGDRGEPVVILHGLFGSLDNWATVSRRLGAAFRVFPLDLRNHGRSPHSDEMSLRLMAGDVAEFLSSHNLDRAHLLGHSLGGKVAMQLALEAPRRVQKLVVVDIAPRAYAPQQADILDALLGLDLTKYESRREVEEALTPRIPAQAIRRFLVKGIMHEPGQPLEWRMNLESIARNYERLVERLPQDREFPGPTLFIMGANSDYILPEDEPEIRRLFPSTTIKVIGGAGHWVHADAPEVFYREVIEFLR